ncbi:MAG: ribosomal-processing cysteine protease Prp [Clostridia bacterium]|nr:ribosomal-processing cysteine protease Prp [Clostridia bacterium]MBR0408785.1 ribosomal-processing cysteine protease Prp [Clostridia bacterium]
MIRVTLHSQGECITGFEVTGHAGYAEAGQDIVCAAVSILTATCANALETVAGVKPMVKAKEGHMLLALPNGSGRDAQVILRTMRQGLRDLSQEYSRYLLLNEL